MQIRYSNTFPDHIIGDDAGPPPGPVRSSRTVRFDEEPAPWVNPHRRRRLILIALAEALDSAAIAVSILYIVPALAHDYLGMGLIWGEALALVPLALWLIIAVRVVVGIWPRD